MKKILLFNEAGLKSRNNFGMVYLNVVQGKQMDVFIERLNTHFAEHNLDYFIEVEPSNKTVDLSEYTYIIPYPGLSTIVKSKLTAEEQAKVLTISIDELSKGNIERIITLLTA